MSVNFREPGNNASLLKNYFPAFAPPSWVRIHVDDANTIPGLSRQVVNFFSLAHSNLAVHVLREEQITSPCTRVEPNSEVGKPPHLLH